MNKEDSLAPRYLKNLEWLEKYSPRISNDKWINSLDMSNDCWTVSIRINGTMRSFRGNSLMNTVTKARLEFEYYVSFSKTTSLSSPF
jgi:hypothetical protein